MIVTPYWDDKLRNVPNLGKLSLEHLAVKRNFDYRNKSRDNSSPVSLQRSQNKNFATVLVQYQIGKNEKILFFHGFSGGSNLNTASHAERKAWGLAQNGMQEKIKEGAEIKKIVVVSELPLCSSYKDPCSNFFSAGGGATKGEKNDLIFDSDRDSLRIVIGEGGLQELLTHVNEANDGFLSSIVVPKEEKKKIIEAQQRIKEQKELKLHSEKNQIIKTNINPPKSIIAKGKEREKEEKLNSNIHNTFQLLGETETKKTKKLHLLQSQYKNLDELNEHIKNLETQRTNINFEIEKLRKTIENSSTSVSLVESSKQRRTSLFLQKKPIDNEINQLKQYSKSLHNSKHDDSLYSAASVGKVEEKKANGNKTKGLSTTIIDVSDKSKKEDTSLNQLQQSSQYMKIGAISAGIAGVAVGSYFGIGIMLPTIIGVAGTIVGGLVGARIDTNLSTQSKEKKETKPQKNNKITSYTDTSKKTVINSKLKLKAEIQKKLPLVNKNSNFHLNMFNRDTEVDISLTSRVNSKNNDGNAPNKNRNRTSNNKNKNSRAKYKK